MLKIREPAPEFDCTAVVEGDVVQLEWNELHGRQNLVLLFASVDEYDEGPDELRTLSNAVRRFAELQCRLAVICRNDRFDILTWMDRLSSELRPQPVGFPAIIDASGEIASLYDMLSEEGPLWGHVIADGNARIRSYSAHAVPLGFNVDELLRCVESIVAGNDDPAQPC